MGDTKEFLIPWVWFPLGCGTEGPTRGRECISANVLAISRPEYSHCSVDGHRRRRNLSWLIFRFKSWGCHRWLVLLFKRRALTVPTSQVRVLMKTTRADICGALKGNWHIAGVQQIWNFLTVVSAIILDCSLTYPSVFLLDDLSIFWHISQRYFDECLMSPFIHERTPGSPVEEAHGGQSMLSIKQAQVLTGFLKSLPFLQLSCLHFPFLLSSPFQIP